MKVSEKILIKLTLNNIIDWDTYQYIIRNLL